MFALVHRLRISPDGRWLAASLYLCRPSSQHGRVVLPANTAGSTCGHYLTGSLRKTYYTVGTGLRLAIAPHGEWLAEGFYHIRLWTLPDGKLLPACFIKKEASYPEAKLIEYTRDGVSYSLPCGSPLPPGAVCTCNCVSGTRSRRRRRRLLVSELRRATEPAEGRLR